MSTRKVRARSVGKVFSLLEELALSNREIVFRGHAQSHYRLGSTLSRYTTIPHESWDSGIDDMLAHFLANLRSIGELPEGIINSRRARLEYGRHCGVPSPLIDFSLSPYVALFFAFTEVRPKPKKEAVVYALDIDSLALEWAKITADSTDGQSIDELRREFRYEGESLFEHGYPGGILQYIRSPASWNRRMVRQLGVFLYDSLNYASLARTDLEDFIDKLTETPATNGSTPMLTKLSIPQSLAGEIFRRLEFRGINATRLYDDDRGAAMDVYNSYHYNRKTGYAWDLRMSPPVESKM